MSIVVFVYKFWKELCFVIFELVSLVIHWGVQKAIPIFIQKFKKIEN